MYRFVCIALMFCCASYKKHNTPNRDDGTERRTIEIPSQTLQKASEGDIDAQIDLAGIYYSEGETSTAIDWYRKAAEQGSRVAEYNLAFLLFTLTEGDIERNRLEAVQLIDRSASKGFASAQVKKGERYLYGDYADKDLLEAYAWFVLAADQRHPIGIERLDRLLEKFSKSQLQDAKERLRLLQSQIQTE